MSKPLPDDMIKATRLTTAGRLGEATELIQRLLRGARSPDDVAFESAREKMGAESSLPRAMTGLIDRLKPVMRAPAAPSLPTVVVPSNGVFLRRTFANKAGSRAYKLYVPSGHKGQPRPLIIMLHGCGQSPDDFAAGTRMNFVAEENTCFVAYPEQTASANSQRCWNWFESGHQNRDQGEPSLIAGIARQIASEYAIDDRRIYIAGLSAGGAAAAVLAEAYPDIFAAVGVHSGLACGLARDMPSAFAAMQGRHSGAAQTSGKQIPTIVFHGDRDSTVHPKNGVEVVARAAAAGRYQRDTDRGSVPSGRTYTRSVHRDARGNDLIEDWVIHGGGHAWSGGSTAGSYTDPKGPDASREMLRFFLKHKRAK